MKAEEREQILDSLIDLMVASKLGAGRRNVVPFVDEDGAFGFYCGHTDDGAVTASVVTAMFEKGGLAPAAHRDADYTSFRNFTAGQQMQVSDVSRVVNDEDSGFKFECRADIAQPQLLETLAAWTAEAQALRKREARYELAEVEKKTADRRRDKVTEVFSTAWDEMFVSAYLIQRTESYFDKAIADVILQPERWTPNSCTVVTTDVSTQFGGDSFDKQCAFKWKLSEVFNSAGAVGSHAEDPGLFALRITGTRARLALDILDHDLDGARLAAKTVAKVLRSDAAAAFKAKFDVEDGKRAAEMAARQGTAKPITIGSPLKLKHA